MNQDELKAKYPEIYRAAFDAGVADGIARGTDVERERIKEIDTMAIPGMETLTNKAKFETGITAGDYAMEALKMLKAAEVGKAQHAGCIVALKYSGAFVEAMKAKGAELPDYSQAYAVGDFENPSSSATPDSD